MWTNFVTFELVLSDAQQDALNALSTRLELIGYDDGELSSDLFPLTGRSKRLATIVDNFIAEHRVEFDAFLNDQIGALEGGGSIENAIDK